MLPQISTYLTTTEVHRLLFFNHTQVWENS